ncbi:MAG: 16S rRNA (cytosine(1402)-N(4))-methyltransferase, partial [Ilumatobacteraceae bacterium]
MEGRVSSAERFEHDPVMRDEIVEVFADVPPGVVLDATLGGGGHAEALLESRADLRVLGL